MSGLCTHLTLPPSFKFVINAMLATLRPLGDAELDRMEHDLALEAFLAIEPRDALEALWAGQVVAMSHAAMMAWREVGVSEDPDRAERYQRSAVMLTRAGAQMIRLIETRRKRQAREAHCDKEYSPIVQATAPTPPTAATRPDVPPRRPPAGPVAAAPAARPVAGSGSVPAAPAARAPAGPITAGPAAPAAGSVAAAGSTATGAPRAPAGVLPVPPAGPAVASAIGRSVAGSAPGGAGLAATGPVSRAALLSSVAHTGATAKG
jgi:hypothetical protein